MRLLQKRGCRVVLTVHNVEPHEGGGRRLGAVYRTPDVLLCHSENASQQLQSQFGIDAERITVVHEGPIVRAAGTAVPPAPAAAKDPAVLFCGVMRPYKGAQVLLDAWAALEGDGSPGQLVIAGGGHPDELECISEGVSRRRLRRVTLHLQSMTTEELESLYVQSDIAVLPYLHASGSETLIRAMSVGLAVVASATGGLQEWVDDRKTGVLVPPGDPAALSRALRELLEDEGLRTAYAAAAHRYVNTALSWPEAARRTLSVYSAERECL